MNKRDFLKLTAATSLGLAANRTISAAPASSETLSDITGDAKPISSAERLARIEKAQALMAKHGLDAILLEAGSALVYFTGVRWWRSERFTGAVIPREGKPTIITPYFEEPSIQESLEVSADVRTWHENENPFEHVREVLADRGVKEGNLGIEETVRYFIADSVRQAAPRLEQRSANPVTRGCRMIKSATELALMQRATDVTMTAYRHIYPRIEAGMNSFDISQMMTQATRALGGSPKFSLVLLNEASAYPHGTRQAQTVREGSLILMDCGCEVHDYESDVSRTWVFGDPSPKQRKVWATVKRGQELALETAKVGVPAGKVDEVVRAFYAKEGFGPGYRTPGLSHRLGHGIGMDGHEPVNFVQGEPTPLAPGMCFSNEPGIYLFGEFGVRLEDCLHMEEDGPHLFSALTPSIDAPFG
ncbi:MAG: Xaa-Pro peptidase family protein [Pseudomonadota bacterium]